MSDSRNTIRLDAVRVTAKAKLLTDVMTGIHVVKEKLRIQNDEFLTKWEGNAATSFVETIDNMERDMENQSVRIKNLAAGIIAISEERVDLDEEIRYSLLRRIPNEVGSHEM